ncbi:MAG: phosphate ABC transporter substrate-binding protein PstS [Candidatus Obscuribacterales bacterium]|nr:phosphate ABC transporter substrate-binding protein PstS [Candidatus Obscuribacterales bacterium]
MKMTKSRLLVAAVGSALLSSAWLSALPANAAEPTTITGAGSTFAKPLYDNWAKSFFQKNPGNLTFDGIGSGAGIGRFQNRVVDLAGSDVPMNDDQLSDTKGGSKDVLHIPTAYGGIVITYNLPGFKGTLNLTGEQIALIYLGKIRNWNDSRLVAVNPSLANINFPIIAFHRGDGSGTTFGFTSYLNVASQDWHATNGAAFATIWPVGDGRGGNGPVVDAVNGNPYSIGYADYNFAVAKKLPMASLKNASGNFVQPTLENIRQAVASVAFKAQGSDDLRLNLIDAGGDSSYPLVTATYIIVHQHQHDTSTASSLAKFLLWGLHDGQSVEASLNYVPLPDNVVSQATKLIQSIDVNGKSALAP